MADIITGLDIGSSSIKGVVLERDSSGEMSVVTAFDSKSKGIRKGIVVDEEEATQALREVVADLEQVSSKASRRVFLNVNGEHIKPRNSQGIVAVSRADQEIQEGDVERVNKASRAVKLQSNYEILHNITSEYFVDDVGEIQDPAGMSGSRLKVETLIVEAFSPHLDKVVEIFRKAGGEVEGMVFTPLASARGVLSKRQKNLGVLFIDIGAQTTSFVVYEEGKVAYTKSIPVGADFVTNDIAIGLKISVDLAEKLKSGYGYALSKDVSRGEEIDLADVDPSREEGETEISKKFLSEIIEVRLEEMFDLVDNELKNLGTDVQLPAGVVISGGGVKIPGTEDLAKKKFGLPAQVGYPRTDDLSVLNPTYEEMVGDPEFSTALGLVFWGQEKTPPPSGLGAIGNFFRNLIP